MPVPPGEETFGEGGGDVVDLLAALQRSVEKARSARGDEPAKDAETKGESKKRKSKAS